MQCDLWFLFYFVNVTVVHLYVLQRKAVPGFVMCLFMRTVYDEINYADKILTLAVWSEKDLTEGASFRQILRVSHS